MSDDVLSINADPLYRYLRQPLNPVMCLSELLLFFHSIFPSKQVEGKGKVYRTNSVNIGI